MQGRFQITSFATLIVYFRSLKQRNNKKVMSIAYKKRKND